MAVDLGELIQKSLAGDSHSQKAIYDQFAPKVYRLATRMAGEAHAADLTQQTFLKMFRGLSRFQGNASFSTWLYRIAVNECLQHRRREKSPTQELPPDLADPSVSPDRRMEDRETIEKALATLEPKLRAIFLLRESEGLSYEQIADVLELPAGTVASQLSRARAELRAFLTKVMSE